MAVRNCHDLGPFAAACWTNSTAPFFAPLKEAWIESLGQVEVAASQQILGQGTQELRQTAPSRTQPSESGDGR